MPKGGISPIHSATKSITPETLAKELTEYLLSKHPTKEQAVKALVLVNRTVDDILENLD